MKVLGLKVIKDGSIWVVLKFVGFTWQPCGWYTSKEKANVAAESLAYCYNCKYYK